ncbi:histidinol dehydrogenase [Paenisporosarcina antarctica]|uniref:Histidinol dehydrogenase n=1 Tax=Paenisporosarcina antarctica TaxID=417367 RepID=A0A4P6ZWP9_9BACL|nr:histidinol dehydrogenase [Paenisporosarcina antarctica]QBP40479.1 histidinol dehydrogenase [Paenisporosarcina antarctica]
MQIVSLSKDISLKRSVEMGNAEQLNTVRLVLADVKNRGDNAIKEYSEKWDHVTLHNFRISKAEIESAKDKFDPQLKRDLEEAAHNIRVFHEKQKRLSYEVDVKNGSFIGQRVNPLDSVGLYVPGGSAAYPSSLLMNVIPAQVAGVERIVIVSPPNDQGALPDAVLVAASILGIEEIYKIGGAQAIAALAYGTESIESVDKITGPGNVFVALAKREVFGVVAIDMIAGPSEIAIIADETAYADEVAADLLSQAEHDPMACPILLTTSDFFAHEVAHEVEKQLITLPREKIARAAVEKFGKIYVAETIDGIIEAVNKLAPEHLEIIANNSHDIAQKIRHAGAIFIGRYSSEPIGDYFAGTNHVLPTNSTARFSSPLSVDDFIKKTSVIYYTKETWLEHAPKIARLARMEGLEGHARAVESRGWTKEMDQS